MQVIKKLAILAVFLALPAFAIAENFPKPSGFVNDFANIINSQTRTQLGSILTQFEKATGNEITVATIQSLNNEPVENYAVAMYKDWGIGKKGSDNGALILVAPNDRQMRIEVGYGLEPYINDALAGRIIRDTMLPHFRQGDFSLGILNGAVELVATIAKKTNVEFDAISAGSISPETQIYHVNNRPQKETSLIAKIFKIIFIIFIILLFIKNPWAAMLILSSFGGGRGGSFRGGFGGGFSGFGGGISGGGGASGRW